MFTQKPKELRRQPTAFDIPEGPGVQAARENLLQAKAAITDAEDRALAIAADGQEAERRLADATRKRDAAEFATRRVALGENIPKPTAHQLASLIEQQARAERDAAEVRSRVSTETGQIHEDLIRRRQQLRDLEMAIQKARFGELVQAYREAIKAAIPLARALREVAPAVGKRCDKEPMLLQTDDDYAGLLFGAKL